MEDKNLYITKKEVGEVISAELDFVNRDEFGFNDYIHDDFVEITKKGFYCENEPINIEQFLSMINKLKVSGATHVEVDYNPDHFEYKVKGYIMKLASADEIADFKVVVNEKSEKFKKIKKLEQEIQKIQNEQ